LAEYGDAFRVSLDIAEQTEMLRQLEEAITLAVKPDARETVRTMLETYRLVIESRSRNDFVSILLHTAKTNKGSSEEEGVK
jgi:hypothetical protein